MSKKILFIGGSMNQTTMMHQISKFFPNDDCFFSSLYTDGILRYWAEYGLLDWTILGRRNKNLNISYYKEHNLNIDLRGELNKYDLVFTCTDLIIPKNIRTGTRLVLVQEGMTDPRNFFYYMVKYFGFPRWSASTSTTGISNLYDKFCIASEGYKEHFINENCDPEKLIITGIPNFDNCKEYLKNDFPHKNYVLVATSDTRETLKFENRKKFLREAKAIANGKQMIFKLHPNENAKRSTREIKQIIPDALVYASGNTNHMIANCDTLVTQYSTVVYIGIALGKDVHSYFDLNELRRMTPIQNDGASARNIADVGHDLLSRDLDQIKGNVKKKLSVRFAQFLSMMSFIL